MKMKQIVQKLGLGIMAVIVILIAMAISSKNVVAGPDLIAVNNASDETTVDSTGRTPSDEGYTP